MIVLHKDVKTTFFLWKKENYKFLQTLAIFQILLVSTVMYFNYHTWVNFLKKKTIKGKSKCDRKPPQIQQWPHQYLHVCCFGEPRVVGLCFYSKRGHSVICDSPEGWRMASLSTCTTRWEGLPWCRTSRRAAEAETWCCDFGRGLSMLSGRAHPALWLVEDKT